MTKSDLGIVHGVDASSRSGRRHAVNEVKMIGETEITRTASLQRGQFFAVKNQASDATPSDQKPREEKGAPYAHSAYKILLASSGSYMVNSDLGVVMGWMLGPGPVGGM